MGARQRVTRMQRLMKQRRLTREQTLDMLNRRARDLGVRDFTLSLRQLDRWLAGNLGTEPRPSTCRVVEAEFGHSIDDLLAFDDETRAASQELVRRAFGPPAAVEAAVGGSAKFAVWADSMRIGDLSLISLRARLTALAHAYVNSPLAPVFDELVDLRDNLFTLITSRPDPGRLPEAYLLAGATCAMLAYASGDLGAPQAAMVQTQAALACAERADNSTLTAWILGNQAMTYDWYGQPRQALRLTAEANIHSRQAQVPGTVLVRLSSIEARAHARLGNAPAAKGALDRAHAARDLLESRYAGGRDELDDMGGILTFTLAKQHFYGGSTYLRIGDPAAAQHAALAALAAYADGPPDERSYGDEALAWVDVAAARVTSPRSDLDAAAQAIGVVHRLPPAMQIPALAQPLSELRRALAAPVYQRAATAQHMRGMIDDLVEQRQRRVTAEITA